MAAASKRLTLPNKLSSLAYDSKTFEICELGRLPPAPRLLFTSEHHAPSCGGTLVTRAIPELTVPFLLLPVAVRIPDTVFQMLKCYPGVLYNVPCPPGSPSWSWVYNLSNSKIIIRRIWEFSGWCGDLYSVPHSVPFCSLSSLSQYTLIIWVVLGGT